MNTEYFISLIETNFFNKIIYNEYKYYSSLKAKELRRLTPSCVTVRKLNMTAYHINNLFVWHEKSYLRGDYTEINHNYINPSSRTLIKTHDIQPSSRRIIVSSLKNILPKNCFDLLDMDKYISFGVTPPMYIKKASYYTQKAILFEIMKKITGVADNSIIGHINSFLTDYKGDIANINPILHKTKTDYKPDKLVMRRNIKHVYNIHTYIKNKQVITEHNYKKYIRLNKIKKRRIIKQFDPNNEKDVMNFCKTLRN